MNKEIKEFWEIDQSMLTKDTIQMHIKEYFKDEFVNNYTMWKENINILDEAILVDLSALNINNDVYESMSFDFFCKGVIDSLCEVVEMHGKIVTNDIAIAIHKVGLDYMNIIINKYNKSTNTVSKLLESIKITKGYFYDVK